MEQKNHELNMRRIRRIHLVGIGGAGMGGIAEVLLNLGYAVSGSDLSKNHMIDHLKKLGICVSSTHHAKNVADADVVVVSSAVSQQNVELVRARERRIPIVQRATMLGELMRFKEGIAIAGTHGKTTTTSLITSLMAEGGLDPTFVIGGRLNSLGRNAQLGAGRYFIAEADESDASFLQLMPMVAVVTNIDRDHLENYQQDFSILKKSYLQFLHRLPFYGLAVVCLDDPEIQSILEEIARPLVTYGFSENADVRAVHFTQKVSQSEFTVLRKNKLPLRITLNLPGQHNVLNALAAIAVATEEGISDEAIQGGLLKFEGVGRRFQLLGEITHHNKRALMIDDYGHHPREIQVVLEALRAGWNDRRLVMVFQPHRYTRTKALFEDFVSILSLVDVLILLDVYSAGEAPIAGADSRALAFSIRSRGRVDPIFLADKGELSGILATVLEDNDVLLMQGAGDISTLATELAVNAKK
ncbi:MAG TPA: UDP-N-acetylmuramate--L-alanine ligase [Gammaproteobacteria bacterium]|nr:UDP-N-acetylmuramate--L-alanine ligase [Gammaproteobacteria bacterium]